MAILKIARMGHPVLRKVAEPVADPTSPEIATLLADMQETLEDIGGNGLAAPQIYVSKRVVLYRLMADRMPPGAKTKPIGWTALINPVITVLTQEKRCNYERCLSLPDMVGKVARPIHVRCDYLTPTGEKTSVEARGFHAIVLQHECDHLDGILYPMQMDDIAEFGYSSEFKVRDFVLLWTPEEFDGR